MARDQEIITAPWEPPRPPYIISWHSLAVRAALIAFCVILYMMIDGSGPHLSPLCRSQAYVDVGLNAATCEQVALAVQRHQGQMAVIAAILCLAALLIVAPWRLWRYRRTLLAWCRIHL